jgi:osmotically-inducible protein OsmY
VRGVYNLIAVEPRIAAEDVRRKLRSTFERSGDDDADRVQIATSGGTVTLSGVVHSWYEHDDAARAAYSIAGVQKVENLTSVS